MEAAHGTTPDAAPGPASAWPPELRDVAEPRVGSSRRRLIPLGRELTDSLVRALPALAQDAVHRVVEQACERIEELLDAVLAVSTGLDEEATLRQIVRAATDLTGARYGALGVLDNGRVGTFLHVGIDEAAAQKIGAAPTGRGVLGALDDHDGPLRLSDLSRHPAAVGFPPHHPAMRTLLGVPIQARGESLGRLYLSGKQGGAEFSPDDEVVVQVLAAAAGIAIHNDRLYAAARDRQAWLAAIGEVTAELLGGTDTGTALRLIAGRARELTGADQALVALPAEPTAGSPATRELTIAVGVGVGVEPVGLTGWRIGLAGSTMGQVFLDRVPQRVSRLSDVDGTFGPALVLPLAAGQGGVLVTARRPGAPEFGEQALTLVSTFVDQAALAMERADVRLARREVELLQDRNRIAQDLHDQVIQRLFAIGLGLQSTYKREQDPRLASRLSDHIDQLHSVIEQIRFAIVDLKTGPARPPTPRSMLLDLLSEMVGDLSLTTTVRLSAALDELPAVLVEDVMAVVRAGLDTAIRHPGVTDLTVSASVERAALVIEIRHDGPADIPDQAARRGEPAPDRGLPGLSRRAAAAGGSLTVSRSPAGGTALVWTAPVP